MPLSLSTQLRWIAATARKYTRFQFKTIVHLLNVEMLERAYASLRKSAAAGIDKVTAADYGRDLRGRLMDLHARLKAGRYRAQPLRRVQIGKEDGRQRPLSIPVLEDKIVQKAASLVLERIYENDFLDCSYGYRPQRHAHQAVDAIRANIERGRVNYVLDADIQDYFGSVVRKKLEGLLNKRIGDRDLLRLIGKWLQVGAIEDGRLLLSEDGLHQGAVISPLLANIYLHEVLDLWIEQTVKPRMRGEVTLYRFADDLLLCFEQKEDAENVSRALPKRFLKFGLTLHPEKTKLIEFGRRAWSKGLRTGKKPKTLNFLGFTFICGGSRKGKFRVKVKTMSRRVGRSLRRVAQWCKYNRHQAVHAQWRRLCAVLRGHYLYYGRRTNAASLVTFRWRVERLWHKELSRRSRGGPIPWPRFQALLRRYPLPPARITEGRFPTTLRLFCELV